MLLRDVIDLEATQGGAAGRGQGVADGAPQRRRACRAADAASADAQPPVRPSGRRRQSMARQPRRRGARPKRGEDDDENALSLSALEEKLKPEVLRDADEASQGLCRDVEGAEPAPVDAQPRPEAQRRVREELREAPQEDRRAGAHRAHQRRPHRAAQALALRPQPQADGARRQAAAPRRGLPHPAPGLPRQLPDARDRPELARQGRQALRARAGRTSPRSASRRREGARPRSRRSPTPPARRSSSSAACARPCRTASAR